MTLVNSARQGRLPGLKRLRDMLAAQLDECDSNRDFAALSTRLIDELEQAAGKKPAARKETGLDEFTRRLEERQQVRRRDAAKGPRRATSSR